jgi:hypothetical protein
MYVQRCKKAKGKTGRKRLFINTNPHFLPQKYLHDHSMYVQRWTKAKEKQRERKGAIYQYKPTLNQLTGSKSNHLFRHQHPRIVPVTAI